MDSPEASRPLYVYVIAVVIVWAILLAAAWLWSTPAHFAAVSMVCTGFFLGMLAMYIAVHLYKWH